MNSVLKEVFNWNQNKQADNEYHRMMDNKKISSLQASNKDSNKKDSLKKSSKGQALERDQLSEAITTRDSSRSKTSLEEILKNKASLLNLPYCEPTQPHPLLSNDKLRNTNNNNFEEVNYLQSFKTTPNVKNQRYNDFPRNINQNSRSAPDDDDDYCDFQNDALRDYNHELIKHHANKVFYNGHCNKIDRGTIEYQSHAAELLRFLGSLWMTRTLCDLVIRIDTRKYQAHRLSLAMFSRKYREEFQKKDRDDNGVHTITLTNTSSCALESILKYIYTAEIDINPANADEILNGAKELGVENLICMAQDYLDSLSIGDVLTYMTNLFDKDGGELVTYELYVYVMTHLTKISKTPEFLRSSLTSVMAILNDSNLSVKSELEVFDAALRWINYDKLNRECATDEVLKCVRFSLMTPEEIHTKIESNHLLKGQKEINNMILKAYKYHSFKCYENSYQNLMHREESRGANLRGSSVPDTFVKALKELAHIACQLKAERASISTNLAKYNEYCPGVNKHKPPQGHSKPNKHCTTNSIDNKKCHCKTHTMQKDDFVDDLCHDLHVKSTLSETSHQSAHHRSAKKYPSKHYMDRQTSVFDLKCAHCGNHGNPCVELIRE